MVGLINCQDSIIGLETFLTIAYVPRCAKGTALNEYAETLGWRLHSSTGVFVIPPNPDNQIKATVTRETITLPRSWFTLSYSSNHTNDPHPVSPSFH
jgi:hypothetical protein